MTLGPAGWGGWKGGLGFLEGVWGGVMGLGGGGEKVGVWGLGFGGLGFEGLGFGCLGFRVQGLGYRDEV